MKKIGSIHWKENEVDWLKKNYSKLGAKECANILKRSKIGIQIKASRIGVKDMYTHWSNKGILILKKTYPKGTIYCSMCLRKTIPAVMNKAKRLDIKVSPIYKSRNYSKSNKINMKNKETRVKISKSSKLWWSKELERLRGRIKTKDGYILIKDHKHPNKDSNNYVQEHVKIMSKHIKRSLLLGEIIHHIDLDKTNNNINNLYLCKNRSEHAKIHWSVNKLVKYFIKNKILQFKGGNYSI